MKREKLNTLSERDFVKGLIVSDKFCRQLCSVTNINLFEVDYTRIVVGWILEYFKKFKCAPKRNILNIYRSHCEEIKDEDLQDNVLSFIQKVCENVDSAFNDDFEIERATSYLNQRNIKIYSEHIQDLVECGEYEKAIQNANDFNHIEPTIGTDVSIFDFEALEEIYLNEEEIVMTIDGDFGKVIGPIHRDDFIAFQAPMKRGKTFALIQMGAEAIFQGLNVLHVSLEMSQKQVYERYLKNLSRSVIHDTKMCKYSKFVEDEDGYKIEKVEKEYTSRTYSEVRDLLRGIRKATRNATVRIYAVPAYSLKVEQLDDHITELIEKNNWVPDVIIVDYADIMAPSDKGEYRNQLDGIWKRLRGLAQKYHCVVFTASQSNRKSLKDDTDIQDIAEDVRKIAHITSLIGINQTKEEKEMCVVRFKQLAVREDAQETREVMCTQNLGIAKMVTGSHFVDEITNRPKPQQKEKN